MRFSADATLEEGSQLLRLIGGREGYVKTRITGAARFVSRFLEQPMSPERAEDIWRKEARPQAHELDAIRAARRQQQEDEARAKAAELGALFSRAATHMEQTDPDFYRDEITRLLGTARALGALDSTVDRK